jgi:hypothetical protein
MCWSKRRSTRPSARSNTCRRYRYPRPRKLTRSSSTANSTQALEDSLQFFEAVEKEYIDVTCDILLHCRGERDDDNLIAVEMKKDYASDERKQRDRQRLQALTLPMPEGGSPDYVCGYQLGYYLEVHIGDATLLIEEYRSGQMTQSGTVEFARPERSRSDSDLFARRESRARKPARRKS